MNTWQTHGKHLYEHMANTWQTHGKHMVNLLEIQIFTLNYSLGIDFFIAKSIVLD